MRYFKLASSLPFIFSKECLFLLKTKALEIEKKPLALIRDCIYLYLTIGYIRVKDHTNAMESGREFLVLARRTGRRDLELMVTCKLAELHMLCGKYQEAKKLFLKALGVFKETGERQGLITCYGNLGNALCYLANVRRQKIVTKKHLRLQRKLATDLKRPLVTETWGMCIAIKVNMAELKLITKEHFR